MIVDFDLSSVADYRKFLQCKTIPMAKFSPYSAMIPDEYAYLLGVDRAETTTLKYAPVKGMFDYQRDITRIAIRKRKYAIFADCGLGKTLCFLDYARHVLKCVPSENKLLITSPIMVIEQTINEAVAWYGDKLPIERVVAKNLADWTEGKTGSSRLGITNYESLGKHVRQGILAGLIVDESSMMKSQYGKWGTDLIRLGQCRTCQRLEAATGTILVPGGLIRQRYIAHGGVLWSWT